MKTYELYKVTLIHKTYDWDAELKFKASGKAEAHEWALSKMSTPEQWLVTKAEVVKQAEAAKLVKRAEAVKQTKMKARP